MADELLAASINPTASTDVSITVSPIHLAGSSTPSSTTSGGVKVDIAHFDSSITPNSTVSGYLMEGEEIVGSVSAQSSVTGILFDKIGIQFQYYRDPGIDDNYALLDSSTKRYGQTFPVKYRHKIYRVDLKLFRVGSPGTITIEIRENDDTGTEYYPSGSVVASGTYDGDSLPVGEGNAEWRVIDLSNPGWLEVDLDVGVDKVYGIVISCTGADGSNQVGWRYDDTSSYFSGGRWCYYNGSTWSQEVGNDFMFGEWGHRPTLTGKIISSWKNTDLTCSRILITYDIVAPFAGGAYLSTVIDSPSYTGNAPISMEETSHNGNMALTFRDDYYYRIHVITTPFDLGLILDDISQEFWIWNAYFESKTLDDIDIEGIVTLTGISAPLDFKALQAEQYYANISKNGLPEFEAIIDFDFGVDGIAQSIITGTRIITLFWRPENNIKETLEWMTEILRSNDGTEQRIKLRQTPRQFFRMKFVIKTDKMNTWYDAIVHTWQKRAWGIPVWPEYVIHTADISAGATVITVDTTNADYRDDGFAIVWKSETEYEVISIDTKTDSSLTLKNSVNNSFSGDKLIMPLRIAYMVSKSIKNKQNSEAAFIEALFAITDNKSITGHTPATEYDNIEVLTVPSYMDDSHGEESDGQLDIVDFNTGLFKIRSDKDFNLLIQNHIFLNDTKEDCWNFRKFLHYMNGRQRIVLIPTFRNDLIQIGTIGSADVEFYIENVKLSFNLGVNNLRTYVGFYFPNETLIIRKVTNIEEVDDSQERITINASLGVGVAKGDCKICFVDKCRFASDSITIDWIFAHRNECRLNMMRVP